jgi:hypothetical protein
MNASPEACEWSGIPAQGSNLLTRLPKNCKTSFSVAFSPCGERAFVPFTAAGQRGAYTPLPRFHPLKNYAVLLTPRSRDVKKFVTKNHKI